MGTHDDLSWLLKKLRLSGVLESLDIRVREAIEDEVGHVEFLVRLLDLFLLHCSLNPLCVCVGGANVAATHASGLHPDHLSPCPSLVFGREGD